MGEIRTYKIRGMRRDGGGYTGDWLEVRAFSAEDALVQIKLKHGSAFSVRTIEPVEDDGPEWFFTCVEGDGEIYAYRRGRSKYDAELFNAVLDERLLEAIQNNWCGDQRKGLDR